MILHLTGILNVSLRLTVVHTPDMAFKEAIQILVLKELPPAICPLLQPTS
jgi:hypothetical protein